MFVRDFLQEYRNGNRARLIVSLATKDERMTKKELTDILTGDFAEKLGYRRALRHPSAPVTLVKKLSRDGEFLNEKCHAYWWDEATAEELHAGAKWMIENDSSSCTAAFYVERPSISEKTLQYLYNNCEDGGYLWAALMLNPKTPDAIKLRIQRGMNRVQIREYENKIAQLKENAAQLKSVG